MVELNDFAAVKTKNATVFHGNNLEVLPFMADNSVDSIVCDPPYELGFMGKSWDSSGIAYSVELWRECLRVLKPGGHLLAFGGSRTWHRIAVAIEDAGFDVRDSIAWLYGSGFPKSHDISKAIDKTAGAEREVIGKSNRHGGGKMEGHSFQVSPVIPDITAPATAEAKKWAGWGTALKPAFEPVVVARKPLVGTVAANVLAWGVGGLNIDASRIGTDGGGTHCDKRDNEGNCLGHLGTGKFSDTVHARQSSDAQGRWPANIILDEYTAELLDEQSGILTSGALKANRPVAHTNVDFMQGLDFQSFESASNSGGASRFFYVAKASKRDRNEGLDESNTHPTVKPTDLMRYLIKLVTPAGGVVLDPFTGSGSTGKAALLDGYQFLGIEMTSDYLPIIQGRLDWAENEYLNAADKENEVLF